MGIMGNILILMGPMGMAMEDFPMAMVVFMGAGMASSNLHNQIHLRRLGWLISEK